VRGNLVTAVRDGPRLAVAGSQTQKEPKSRRHATGLNKVRQDRTERNMVWGAKKGERGAQKEDTHRDKQADKLYYSEEKGLGKWCRDMYGIRRLG